MSISAPQQKRSRLLLSHLVSLSPVGLTRLQLILPLVGLGVVSTLLIFPAIVSAGTTPPVTTHTLGGTLGQNGWYRSNIDVTLTVTDNESGPDTTTYWLDSDPPTVVDHESTTVAQFKNNSFENGWFLNIKKWYPGLYGLALYYQSRINPYDGNKTAAIAFIGFSGEYYHWHNEPYAVAVTPGQSLQVSAWVRTVMISGETSYFEVWGQDAGGSNDQLIVTSPTVSGFNWQWQQLTAQFVVPSGVDEIYVKLGSSAVPLGIVYWDLAQIQGVNNQFEVNFTMTQEGEHILHYYSEDNNGNVEAEHTVSLKKDTIDPSPWQNFTAERSSCDHCYVTTVEIRDITSGVNVTTAEYRYYTEFQDQYWSDWLPVDQVLTTDTGLPASSGETSYVDLVTPEIDFGDSSPGPERVQFRIYDVAGNLSTSPVYEIASPWITTSDGSIFIGGEISLPPAQTGEPVAKAEVATSTSSAAISSATGWVTTDYGHVIGDSTDLSSLIPEYLNIKAKASSLPGGDLPTIDGIYLVPNDYSISASTLGGFESANVSAVVIVEGDLTINKGFTVGDANHTVFLVEGDLLVDQNVEQMAGFYITQGYFNSDTSGKSKRPLTVYGSVIALTNYVIGRDLGSSGTENNTNTPAESFVWQPAYLVDQTLAGYLRDRSVDYVWQEIERP